MFSYYRIKSQNKSMKNNRQLCMPYNINVTSAVYFVTHRKMMLHEYVTPETFQTDVSWITL